jgi:hypothetical protein
LTYNGQSARVKIEGFASPATADGTSLGGSSATLFFHNPIVSGLAATQVQIRFTPSWNTALPDWSHNRVLGRSDFCGKATVVSSPRKAWPRMSMSAVAGKKKEVLDFHVLELLD